MSSFFHQIVAAFPEGWLSSGQISRDGGFILPCISNAVVYLSVYSERHEEEI